MSEWASVEELLSEQSRVHETVMSVYGKRFSVFWAELEEDEYPEMVPKDIEKLSMPEKLEFAMKLNEDIVIAMIEKGQKMKEAEVGELKFKFTKQSFKALRPRIRNEITTTIFQAREANAQNL